MGGGHGWMLLQHLVADRQELIRQRRVTRDVHVRARARERGGNTDYDHLAPSQESLQFHSVVNSVVARAAVGVPRTRLLQTMRCGQVDKVRSGFDVDGGQGAASSSGAAGCGEAKAGEHG